MKLPRSLTTVTTFSKLIALFLFTLFPFAGFFTGITYQKNLNASNSSLNNTYEAKNPPKSKNLQSTPLGLTIYEDDSVTFMFPATWEINEDTNRVNIYYKADYIIFLESIPNLNIKTNLPYSSLQEVINTNETEDMQKVSWKTIQVANVNALESQQIYIPSVASYYIKNVYLFSKDKNRIYKLSYETRLSRIQDIQTMQKVFNDVLSTFQFIEKANSQSQRDNKVSKKTISSEELSRIYNWIIINNLDRYGNPSGTVYTVNPTLNEATGELLDDHEYIIKKYPTRPWNK